MKINSKLFSLFSPAEKLYISTGRELRRALFSLKQIFQDDKDLVHEFVMAEGLTCLIKVGAEADQNYQNYILRDLRELFPHNPSIVAEPGVPQPSGLHPSSRLAQIHFMREWRKSRWVPSSCSRRESPELARPRQQNPSLCSHNEFPGEEEHILSTYNLESQAKQDLLGSRQTQQTTADSLLIAEYVT
ncbi:unnamed protein product [Leuciscus chuanchicus]